MSTGVTVASDVITEFNEFKLRNKYRFIIYHINNNQIEIEKTGPPSATYADFLASLPSDDCRFATLNFEYDSGEDGKRSKVVFFLWAPDTAKIKSKMVYAGSKDSLKKSLQGLQIEIQGTDKSEVDESEVLAKCKAVSK